MSSEPRRLPAPWRIIEHTESFEVQDAVGHKIAYVYFEDGRATLLIVVRPSGGEEDGHH
jgi:hypothetical protein